MGMVKGAMGRHLERTAVLQRPRARPIKIGPRAAWAQGCGPFPIPAPRGALPSRRETIPGSAGVPIVATHKILHDMAIAVPHQPRYQRRGAYIYYLLGERMVIRTRPARVRDPRTPAQRRQRLRMRVASTFLKGFQRIVSRGFEPQLQENFRKVGAYQLALGHLMRHALRDEKGGVTLDTARVQLAQGRPSPLGAVRGTVRCGAACCGWPGRARCRPRPPGCCWGCGTGGRRGRCAARRPARPGRGGCPWPSRPTGRATRWTCGWCRWMGRGDAATSRRTARRRARRSRPCPGDGWPTCPGGDGWRPRRGAPTPGGCGWPTCTRGGGGSERGRGL